ncbi:mitochondrial ATP synthase epsilon chain-domain-containing protein [Ganoderma leucocontextum]|nr:mitochondrial ATP synthase epsilon chain-domain-containing protein [Ganoderma leucocontextum]
MSSATWCNVFTYNKYTQIAARALRASLKEEERVAAEKRGLTILRYQRWENGQGGSQTFLNPPPETDAPKKAAV